MPADPNILEIPPGEYTIPGVDRVLVVQGAAYWRLPTQPANLADLAKDPAAPPAPSPNAGRTAAPAPPSLVFYLVLALAAAGAGAWALPRLDAWFAPRPDAPVDPMPVDPRPVDPRPAPPAPRPDWLPQLEARLDHLEQSATPPPPSVPSPGRPSPQSPPR